MIRLNTETRRRTAVFRNVIFQQESGEMRKFVAHDPLELPTLGENDRRCLRGAEEHELIDVGHREVRHDARRLLIIVRSDKNAAEPFDHARDAKFCMIGKGRVGRHLLRHRGELAVRRRVDRG